MEQPTVQAPSMSSETNNPADPSKATSAKPPVVRGARACTVCRAAKMKCVGAEDGQPCQRCKRSGSECVFEKHRRGRKPGSKLSEASKMLRRLEKGLNSAKLKVENEARNLPFPPDGSGHDRFPNNELPPLNLPPDYDSGFPSAGKRSHHEDEDDDEDPEKPGEGFFPAKLIQKERNSSYFKTILNPESSESQTAYSGAQRSHSPAAGSSSNPPPPPVITVPGLDDPITAGLIDEAHASVLFDLFFLRLNPFINLFDPALHTVHYIRSRCPFLFTTIIMACCKFFEMDLYKRVHKMAHEFAVRAFAENWKRVEVCQAFACLTYWKEPEENRTWTYIGYACRMAVELGLNRYVGKRPQEETDLQLRERRNRERTYLVLFVHDRSLSTQTGRQWMLPECELVRRSSSWHEEGAPPSRPEDVILAAFVQLRRIASDTTEVFYSHRGISGSHHSDVNHDVLLRNCNGKLTQWDETWQNEMRKAGGEKFHFAFLNFFRLYVRLFLNSFGIQASMSSTSRASPSLQALSACYTSALDNLRIVTEDFANMQMLRYGQDSITVMTAYAAVFLLKLLRSTNILADLEKGATQEIYTSISRTADAYSNASLLSPSSGSAASHARFLRGLVNSDIFRVKQAEKEKEQQIQRPLEPRLSPTYTPVGGSSQMEPSPTAYPQPMTHQPVDNHSFHFPASPNVPTPPLMASQNSFVQGHTRDYEYQSMSEAAMRSGPPVGGYNSYPGHSIPQPQQPYANNQVTHATEADAMYWKNMFRELGFGETVDGTGFTAMNGYASTMPDVGLSGMPIASPMGPTGGNMGYTDSQMSGYMGHPVRPPQYPSYPSQSYNSHPSHPGYGNLGGR